MCNTGSVVRPVKIGAGMDDISTEIIIHCFMVYNLPTMNILASIMADQ